MPVSIIPDLENYDVVETNTTITSTTRGKSFNFDFNAGDFVLKDGKVEELTGIESLKVWILKLIKTEKFKFRIYETGLSDEYGITLMDLIHSDYPYFFIKSEIQREVSEGLLKNNEISSIENFIFIREKRTPIITFTINSIYGPVENEVIF